MKNQRKRKKSFLIYSLTIFLFFYNASFTLAAAPSKEGKIETFLLPVIVTEAKQITGDSVSQEAGEDVSAEDAILDNNLDNIIKESPDVQEVVEDISIELPTDLDFTIDVFDIGGKGQIYSEEFPIINTGKTDIYVKLENIECYSKTEEQLVFHPEPFEGYSLNTEEKDIYMYMNVMEYSLNQMQESDVEDRIVITDTEGCLQKEIFLKAAQYDSEGNLVTTQIDNKATFDFHGVVNANAANPWRRGDVKVRISYSISEESTENPKDSIKDAVDLPQVSEKPEAVLPETSEKPEAVLPETSQEPEILLPEESKNPVVTLPEISENPADALPETSYDPVMPLPKESEVPETALPKNTEKPIPDLTEESKNPIIPLPEESKNPDIVLPEESEGTDIVPPNEPTEEPKEFPEKSEIILDIAKGDILITKDGWIQGEDSGIGNSHYTLTGISNKNRVLVESGINDITIDGLNIQTATGSAIDILPNAWVYLTLKNENKLSSGYNIQTVTGSAIDTDLYVTINQAENAPKAVTKAAIDTKINPVTEAAISISAKEGESALHVPFGAGLEITKESTGTLMVYSLSGAGIGANCLAKGEQERSGSISILSGYVSIKEQIDIESNLEWEAASGSAISGTVVYVDGSIPSPERKGYEFYGWHISDFDSVSEDPESFDDGYGIALYTFWKPMETWNNGIQCKTFSNKS